MCEVIDKLALVHCRNGRMLMVRTRGRDKFYNPGGKRIGDESDIDALCREIREELNVEIIPESVKPYGVFTRPADNKPDGVMVQMTCYTAEFRGDPAPGAEIEELAWLNMSDWDRISSVGELIFTDAYKKGLIS